MMLETQATQLSQQQNMCASNQFPSQLEHKGKEPSQMNAVTTRSGKQLVVPPLKEVTPTGSISMDLVSNADEVDGKTAMNDDGNVKSKSRVRDLLIKHVPFPQKLAQALKRNMGNF